MAEVPVTVRAPLHGEGAGGCGFHHGEVAGDRTQRFVGVRQTRWQSALMAREADAGRKGIYSRL